MKRGPFFNFKQVEPARKKSKIIQKQLLRKIGEIAEYRLKKEYAFNPLCKINISELASLLEGETSTSIISIYKASPVKTLATAILLHNVGYPKLLDTLLEQIPAKQIPLHHSISTTRSEPDMPGFPLLLAFTDYAPNMDTFFKLYKSIPLNLLIPDYISPNEVPVYIDFGIDLVRENVTSEFLDQLLENKYVLEYLKKSSFSDQFEVSFAKAVQPTRYGYGKLITTLLNLGFIDFLNGVNFSEAEAEMVQENLFMHAAEAATRGFPEVLRLFLATEGPLFGHSGLNSLRNLPLAILSTPNLVNDSAIEKACQTFIKENNIGDLLKQDVRLFRAILTNNPAMAKEILEKCGDKESLLSQSIDGMTAFQMALIIPRLEIVEILLDAGVNVNEKIVGMSPLHYAVHFSNPKLTKLLLEKNADINALTFLNETALKMCLSVININLFSNIKSSDLARQKQILKILLSHKPDLSRSGSRQLLQSLGKAVSNDIVKSAIKEVNDDYLRFYLGVKGIYDMSGKKTPVPSEILGMIMSHMVDYKSEKVLASDAQPIMTRWHAHRVAKDKVKKDAQKKRTGRKKKPKV